MIKCPNCGKKISEFAVNCPHCGKKNTVNGNDTTKVAELKTSQQKETKKKIKLYAPLIITGLSFILSFLTSLVGVIIVGINKSGNLTSIIALLTSSSLSIGISFLYLQRMKKYNDWKFIDTIVFAVSSIKIIIFIIRSIIDGIINNMLWDSNNLDKIYDMLHLTDILSYAETGYFQIRFVALFGNFLALCFYLLPMVWITFFMVKKKPKEILLIIKKTAVYICIVSFVIGIGSVIYSKMQMPKVKQYIEEEEYKSAYDILKTIPKNKYVRKLSTELQNESYILSSLKATKEYIEDLNKNVYRYNSNYKFTYDIDTYVFSITDTLFYEYDSAILENRSEASEFPVILVGGKIERIYDSEPTNSSETNIYTLCYYDSKLEEYRCYAWYDTYATLNLTTLPDLELDSVDHERLLIEYYLYGTEIELEIDSQRIYNILNTHKENSVDVLK